MFELAPYERTRPAALPWLRHIPEHWRIARGKAVMSAVDVRSATGEEELLTVSSSRGVVPRSSASVSMFKAESYVGHKLCWPDDLVACRS
jgi:type I restriction enzyme S subunit